MVRFGTVAVGLVLAAGSVFGTPSAWAFDARQVGQLRDTKACERCDLGEASLKNLDLKGANLARAKLVDADLKGADLSGADLAGADMRRADLEKATLVGANLARSNGAGVDMEKSDIGGRKSHLPGQNKSGALTLSHVPNAGSTTGK